MAEWRRRSIAGGPLPPTPNVDNRDSTAPVVFPGHRDGDSGAARSYGFVKKIMPGRWLIREIADEAFVPHGADRNSGDRRMPLLTIGPLPRKCQPAGRAPAGGHRGDGGSQDDAVDTMLYCDEVLEVSKERDEEPDDQDEELITPRSRACFCPRCFAISGRRRNH